MCGVNRARIEWLENELDRKDATIRRLEVELAKWKTGTYVRSETNGGRWEVA